MESPPPPRSSRWPVQATSALRYGLFVIACGLQEGIVNASPANFLAVLESGSMLKASRQLNLSQPALSKSISTLESAYGVALFKRLARGVQPTASALALERHARRILDDLQASRNVLDALAAGASGTITFGTGASFVTTVSEGHRGFGHRYPRWILRWFSTQHLYLLGNQSTFRRHVQPPRRRRGLRHRADLSDRFVGVCSSNHPFGTTSDEREALRRIGRARARGGRPQRSKLFR